MVVSATGYSPHAAILVNGNNGFNAASGVVSGTGTSHNPYIISGWELLGTVPYGTDAALIENTRAYFVMENLYIPAARIHFVNVTNAVIQDSLFTGPVTGIRIDSSSSVTITRNSLTNADVLVYDSQAVTISQNSLYKIPYSGIIVLRSDATITRNNVMNASIQLSETAAGTISQNNVTDGSMDVLDSGSASVTDNRMIRSELSLATVLASTNVMVTGNTMTEKGIEFFGPPPAGTFSISTTNQVNGKPVYFYNNCHGLNINGTVMGQLILMNCQNVTATNLNLALTGTGVYAASVDNFLLQTSKLNADLMLLYSSNIRALSDQFRTSGFGPTITADHSTNVTLAKNTISSNPSPNNNVGTKVVDSVKLNLTNNTIENYGRAVWTTSTQDTVIQSNTLSNNGDGLILESDSKAVVEGNLITHNTNGIAIEANYFGPITGGTGLNITGNQIAHNQVGVAIYNEPTNSTIYHNNFVFNTVQAAETFTVNPMPAIWGNGYPSGGNYWSDYTGVDHCSGPAQDQCSSPDGIGDTPYTGISTTCGESICTIHVVDQYPLMHPFGNFPQETPPPGQPPGTTGGSPSPSGPAKSAPNTPGNLDSLLRSLSSLPQYAYALIAAIAVLGAGFVLAFFRIRRLRPPAGKA